MNTLPAELTAHADKACDEFVPHSADDLCLTCGFVASRHLAKRAAAELSASTARAHALRDVVCQIFSATGAYSHEIPRFCKEALERDDKALDQRN